MLKSLVRRIFRCPAPPDPEVLTDLDRAKSSGVQYAEPTADGRGIVLHRGSEGIFYFALQHADFHRAQRICDVINRIAARDAADG